MATLFGGSDSSLLTTVFALGIVLALIVLSVWVLKFVLRTSTNVARGTGRRLMLVESMQLDPRRQVLIVRRDDVEHVILTGGPQDLLLESGIQAEKVQSRRPVPVVPGRPPNPFLNNNDPVPRPANEPENEPGAIIAATHEGTAFPPPSTRPRMHPPIPPSAVERLREFARPVAKRATRSLRHTGLMRAVSPEVFAAEDRETATDSATSNPVAEAKGAGAGSEDAVKAGGN